MQSSNYVTSHLLIFIIVSFIILLFIKSLIYNILKNLIFLIYYKHFFSKNFINNINCLNQVCKVTFIFQLNI